MIPRLSGVGVGPGDPNLVTVKGVAVMRAADVVFVPVSADPVDGALRPGYAEGVVLAHVDPGRVRRLVFALGDDSDAARARGWDDAGDAVAAAIADGGHAAFATIGDPNLYSTFTALATAVRARLPRLRVDTVPGITALQDLASRSGTVLAEGSETLALLPLHLGRARFADALARHDTVVAYKGGRFLPDIRAALVAAGRLDDAVYGSRLGLAGEQVGRLPDDAAVPYLSTVLVTRRRP